MHNFDTASFYTKHLDDIARAQLAEGSLSDVVPPYWPLYPADPAWGTAYATIAWSMYQYYATPRFSNATSTESAGASTIWGRYPSST